MAKNRREICGENINQRHHSPHLRAGGVARRAWRAAGVAWRENIGEMKKLAAKEAKWRHQSIIVKLKRK
jgi:hypothetical protein